MFEGAVTWVTPMGYEAGHNAAGMHLYAATPDDPGGVESTLDVTHESRLPRLKIACDLPKHRRILLNAPG